MFWLTLVSTCFNSCWVSNTNKPKNIDVGEDTQVEFKNKQHQFGDVVEGETVGCYFIFKNTGEYNCIIKNVDAGCGCLKVSYTKMPILPGDKGEVEVKFNTKGFKGLQYKVVKLKLNTKDKETELIISANVIN